ncbi:MAG: hypothetical protein FVQ80_10895 [Planctomycetes bacterium]|nr:hypothetical protein [Planctomycetota bacterium]
MPKCTVTKNLKIVPGNLEDYKALSHFHYRGKRLGPFKKIFAIRPAIAAIVYTMPSPVMELRNIACGQLFNGLDRKTRITLINDNICCIGRVIVEPRYRGLGLAGTIVRETMKLMDTPIVEAAAVMGLVNPFFEKAGMTAYRPTESLAVKQLTEAFSIVGIESRCLLDPKTIHKKINSLGVSNQNLIETQIQKFLQKYNAQRYMPHSIERTRFVLSKLTKRPMYYIWFNPKKELTLK